MSDNNCHVCYEEIAEGKGVTCENGHSCCQKHHLERVRAIYQEGCSAFGTPSLIGEKTGDSGQCCFICRQGIPDNLFSENYKKCLLVIQAIEIPKMLNAAAGLPPDTNMTHPLDDLATMEALRKCLRGPGFQRLTEQREYHDY
jgi:hypothetical protein